MYIIYSQISVKRVYDHISIQSQKNESKKMIKDYLVSIRMAGHGSARALESLMNL